MNQETTFTYDQYNNLISITNSTDATTTFTYDVLDNMTSQTDASGNTTRFQLRIEDVIEGVIKNPDIGEPKKGDLSGFRVHKFKFQRQGYLMAYKMQKDNIIFYMIDTYENFYREFKRYKAVQ